MTREEAVEKLEAFAPMVVDDTREALDMAIEALQAEPVKHGKWTVDEKHTEEIYTNPVYCSVCGKDVVMDYGEYAQYCPNCGAKMKID